MEIVVDSQVIIYALLFPNNHPDCVFLVDLFLDKAKVAFVFSQKTLSELVLIFSRLAAKKRLVYYERLIYDLSELIWRSKHIPSFSRFRIAADEEDNKLLECAYDAGVRYVIMCDKKSGLLDLGNFQDIQILTPAKFLEQLAVYVPA